MVENINEEYLHDVLTELSNQTFFRLFRVDLTRECKFWQKLAKYGKGGGGKEGKEEEEGSCSAPPASFGNGKAKPSEDGLYFEESNDKKEVNATFFRRRRCVRSRPNRPGLTISSEVVVVVVVLVVVKRPFLERRFQIQWIRPLRVKKIKRRLSSTRKIVQRIKPAQSFGWISVPRQRTRILEKK